MPPCEEFEAVKTAAVRRDLQPTANLVVFDRWGVWLVGGRGVQ